MDELQEWMNSVESMLYDLINVSIQGNELSDIYRRQRLERSLKLFDGRPGVEGVIAALKKVSQ